MPSATLYPVPPYTQCAPLAATLHPGHLGQGRHEALEDGPRPLALAVPAAAEPHAPSRRRRAVSDAGRAYMGRRRRRRRREAWASCGHGSAPGGAAGRTGAAYAARRGEASTPDADAGCGHKVLFAAGRTRRMRARPCRRADMAGGHGSTRTADAARVRPWEWRAARTARYLGACAPARVAWIACAGWPVPGSCVGGVGVRVRAAAEMDQLHLCTSSLSSRHRSSVLTHTHAHTHRSSILT
jgi:hypothetical protein